MKLPDVGSIWYIESKSGRENWYRVMRVVELVEKMVCYQVIDSNDGTEKYGHSNLKSWHAFSPKDVTNDYPEYLL